MSEQGTDGWKAQRLGRVTASRMADVMAKPTTAAYRNYVAQLMTERDTGIPTDSFTSTAMQWGTDTEPQARAAYEWNETRVVVETGFVPHPTIADTGASPDGLVDEDGLIEIKCPNTATHYATLLSGTIDRKYVLQMQWQMACTGRTWCDFVSFDPRVSPAKQYFCKRIARDDDLIAELEAAVVTMLEEVKRDLSKLNELYPEQEAA